VSTKTAAPQATTGKQLLVALLTVGRRLRSRLPESRVDPAMMLVLHHVFTLGDLRVSELAVSLGIDASTASRHVRQLEDGGYLSRAGDPGDRRASRVRLTPRGRAALDRALRARASLVDRAVADWPDEDRAALATLITRLADSLDRLAADPETR
jgi:DNA-binding MarR family transcriptional regulator